MAREPRRASARFALAFVSALAVACGGGTEPAPSIPGADRLSELRERVAARPKSLGARRELARVALAAGLPGEAFRHLRVVEVHGRLGGDRGALAELYAGRARERVAIGDPGAYRDLEAASRLGLPAREHDELAAGAYFAAALGAFRRGDPAGERDGRRYLERAGSYATGDPRLALLDADEADVEALGDGASWLFDGGAVFAALAALERYVSRGGRAPGVAARYLEAHAWWHGDSRRPPLLLVDELVEAGAPACAVAATPSDSRCRAALEMIARDGRQAAALWRRADVRHWRTARAAEAGAWAVLALRASQRGGAPSWLAGLTRRVDVEAIAGSGASGVPAFAVATIYRAAGAEEAAREALVSAARSAGALDPHERAVLAAEASAQRADRELVEAIVDSGEVAPEGLVAVALALRAAGGSSADEAAFLARGPSSWPRQHLALRGDLGALAGELPAAAATLAEWWRALSHPALEAARAEVAERWRVLGELDEAPAFAAGDPPFGAAIAARIAEETPGVSAAAAAQLARIAAAHEGDPEAAERRARRFVDGGLALAGRGAAVAELFFRLGDDDRARAWAEAIADESPEHPPAVFAAGRAAAAAGDVSAAEIHFAIAAAASGSPGAYWLAAADQYERDDELMAAVGAARRAIAHGAPGERGPALAAAGRILRALGRDADAEAALAQLVRETPAPFRDAARARARDLWGDRELGAGLAGPTWRGTRDRALAAARANGGDAAAVADRAWRLDPTDGSLAAEVARAELATGADQDELARRLDTTIAWDPTSATARAIRLSLGETGDARVAGAVAELLYLGLTGTAREPAADVLAAAAAGLELLGADEAAHTARRHADRSLRGAGVALPEDLRREHLDHRIGVAPRVGIGADLRAGAREEALGVEALLHGHVRQ